MYPSNWTLFYFSDVYLALDTLHIYLTNDRQCLAYQAQNITQVLNYTFSSSSRRPTHQRGHARRHALLGRRPAGRRDQQSALVHGLRHLLGCYASLTDRSPAPPARTPARCSAASAAAPSPRCAPAASTPPRTTAAPATTSATSRKFQPATCQLLTGLDDKSYGNQSCSACTKQVTDSASVGTCGCSFQPQTLQQ